MPGNAPAIWSAVAASFSALSSFMIMMIHRRNLLESARPELVLTGWQRRREGSGEGLHDVIAFSTMRNVGRGAALNVHVTGPLGTPLENPPKAFVFARPISIVAPNDTVNVNGEITIWWKNVKPEREGYKHLLIIVTILCWDARGMRHETKYTFLAIDQPERVAMSEDIAPGVGGVTRSTVTKAVWVLRLGQRPRVLSTRARTLWLWAMDTVRRVRARG